MDLEFAMNRALTLWLLTIVFVPLLGLSGACPGEHASGLDAGPAGALPAEPFDAGTSPNPFLEVSGVVVDQNNLPVAGAWVMQGGRAEERMLTQEDGSFTFVLEDPGWGLSVLVAAKPGYRAVGMEHFMPGMPVTLTIHELAAPDNEEYVYEELGDGYDIDKEDCTHCHAILVREFLDSKHAQATRSPLLQDLYAGVNRTYENQTRCENAGGVWRQGLTPGTDDAPQNKCYIGGGVLGDLNGGCGGENQSACDDPAIGPEAAPTVFGSCADCHAPGINGVAGGRNLHEATGLAYEKGVHCDVCHKVKDIDMSQPPGVGQRLVMGRPGEEGFNVFKWRPVYFGPLIDVPIVAMGGSYQPKFNEAVFCAGCHQQEQPALLPNESLDNDKWPNGLPIHATYEEWLDGPYNQESTACQFCHMPERYGRANSTDLGTVENQSIMFGFVREPEDNRQHIFRSPLHGEPRLIDKALYTSINLTAEGQSLNATVSVSNVGCGHAVPTGEPMRSLIMVVEATTENCGPLIATGGMTLSDTAGMLAEGVEGTHTQTTESTVSWAQGAAVAQAGLVIRVARATGTFDDYDGVGYFGEAARTAEEKGLEIYAPVGEATVQSVAGSEITLSRALDVQEGDRVYLGEAMPEDFQDGDDALHLAGKPGYAFSKVLVDSAGNRHVPHYKAVDMASDNRIPPGKNAVTQHTFTRPSSCGPGTVAVKVYYRPVPLSLAKLRGWDAADYLISESNVRFD